MSSSFEYVLEGALSSFNAWWFGFVSHRSILLGRAEWSNSQSLGLVGRGGGCSNLSSITRLGATIRFSTHILAPRITITLLESLIAHFRVSIVQG